LPKILPFELAATSARLGWVGLEAVRFRGTPAFDLTAQKSADGSVAVQFDGCNGRIPNCLPIMAGWNYMVRLYRPRAEILNGTWRFPEARP
jgi:hypothetical protein